MDSIIIFCAKYLVFFVALLIAWIWFKENTRGKKKLAAQVILAGVIAAILIKLAGKLYYDPRPFIDGHVKPLFAHGPDNGFPSDHTALAMTLTAVMYYYNRQLAAVALVLTLLTGLGRVLAHVHSPIDIAGGLVIGLIAGWASWWAMPKVIKVYKNSRNDKQAKD